MMESAVEQPGQASHDTVTPGDNDHARDNDHATPASKLNEYLSENLQEARDLFELKKKVGRLSLPWMHQQSPFSLPLSPFY